MKRKETKMKIKDFMTLDTPAFMEAADTHPAALVRTSINHLIVLSVLVVAGSALYNASYNRSIKKVLERPIELY